MNTWYEESEGRLDYDKRELQRGEKSSTNRDKTTKRKTITGQRHIEKETFNKCLYTVVVKRQYI